MRCPSCCNELNEEKNPDGFFYSCPKCRGRLVNLHLLQKLDIPPAHYSALNDAANSEPASMARECPACRRKMSECKLSAKKEITLDICNFCRMVWFDPSEFRMLRFNPPKFHPVDLPPECKEAFALALVKEIEKNKSKYDSVEDEEQVSYSTEWLASGLRLPMKLDSSPVEKTPILTWILAAFIGFFFIAILIDNSYLVNELGFVSAAPFRAYGLTIVTSFFTHANFFHVVINLYFLIVFGENVEDNLDKLKFIALILFSHVAGLFLYCYLSPDSTIPCLGASAGVLGILAYYATAFPYARIRIGIYSIYPPLPVIRNSMSAIIFLAIFVALQLLGAWRQEDEALRINYFAHLGGLGVGVAAAVAYRLRASRKETETA